MSDPVIRQTQARSIWFACSALLIALASSAASAGTYQTSITHRFCDVEERQYDGKIIRSSSDLELGFDGSVETIVGVCFENINVPPGAVITNAYIQFKAKEDNDDDPATFTILGHAEVNAGRYTKTPFSLTARPKTAASVVWNPGPWITPYETGPEQRTPNLASIVEEIVALPGWETGNSLSFQIAGTAGRTAWSLESGLKKAPVLHIDFVGDNPNLAPTINAGADQQINYPAATSLTATLVDDANPAPAAILWEHIGGSGLGTVSFSNAAAATTGITITDDAGVYRLKVTADDGEYTASDELEIYVYPPDISGINSSIYWYTDDAEENEYTGYVDRHSSDLELPNDRSDGDQTIGLRFQSMAIPKNAVITSAYIQFATDETGDNETNLTIYGQAASNPGTFKEVAYDISSRPVTNANAVWSPEPWEIELERGPKQQTPDLSEIVQELVDRSDWAAGNSMAFIVQGTGRRTAIARNSSLGTVNGYLPSENAPMLHVEFGGPGSNRKPTVDAPESTTLVFPQTTMYLDATATDDGQPNPELTVLWEHVGGTGTGVVSFGAPDSIDTPVTFSQETGSYVLRVTVDDGEYSVADELTVNTYFAGGVAGMQQVNHTHTGFDGLGVPLAVPAIDPAGVLYYEPTNSLLIVDSEINEVLPAFDIVQANLFVTNVAATSTFNQFDLTIRQGDEPSRNREPTGIAYCATDGHFYISNDDAQMVYRYSYDGVDFTLVDWIDIWDYSYDPEGMTCDPATGRLYVVGGTSNHLVVLDYTTTGFNYIETIDLPTTAGDPNGIPSDGEGVAFDPATGHLFILSNPDEALYEFTTSGAFVQKLSYQFFTPELTAGQGLSIGPSSSDPQKTSFYIVDGGVDNDWDPNERDGVVYEAEILRVE